MGGEHRAAELYNRLILYSLPDLNICTGACHFAQSSDTQQTAIEMLNKRNGNRVNILHSTDPTADSSQTALSQSRARHSAAAGLNWTSGGKN